MLWTTMSIEPFVFVVFVAASNPICILNPSPTHAAAPHPTICASYQQGGCPSGYVTIPDSSNHWACGAKCAGILKRTTDDCTCSCQPKDCTYLVRESSTCSTKANQPCGGCPHDTTQNNHDQKYDAVVLQPEHCTTTHKFSLSMSANSQQNPNS